MNLVLSQIRYLLISLTILFGLGFSLGMAGCAATNKPATLPPGAINSFDAATYDLLMTAQGALNGFKAELASLPADQVTKVTPVLDQAIKDYNLAEAGWHAYHEGAGGDPAALSASVSQVVADLASLQSAIPQGKK